MDNLDLKEKILGGVFGLISIIAAIAELCANGFSFATVSGTVKDIFATLIVVVLFVAVMRTLNPPKAKNFRELLDRAMINVQENYNPLIRKAEEKETDSEAKTRKLQTVIRYEIATDINTLFSDGNSTSYIRFFDINADSPDSIIFPIRESFFGKNQEMTFDAEKIGLKISGSLQRRFPEYGVSIDNAKKEILVDFKKTLSTTEDAETLCRLIDTTVLLFIAENKKR